MRTRALAALVAAALAAAPTAAQAARPLSYQGYTSQGHQISFKRSAAGVYSMRIAIRASCKNAAGEDQGDYDFTLRALDVIHSFWVPEFGQKQDAVPGTTTQVTITPNKLGTYPIICTELCGLGHAVMRSAAVVMSQADFDKWAKGGGQAAGGGGGTAAGKTVFVNNGCGACHQLKAAGATGKIGPDLDKLAAYAQSAGKPLEDFTRESIVNPDAYVEKGYPPNVMPHTFKSLPKDQLDSLVKYLAASSKGA